MMDGHVDVLVQDHGSIVLLHPVTDAAQEWIAENVSEEAIWFGAALAVEHRYATDVIGGMIEGGLLAAPCTWERPSCWAS